MAEAANRYVQVGVVPEADALLGLCELSVDTAANTAYIEYWSNRQYEPTVLEQIASEQIERDRLAERAAYFATLNGPACEAAL